MRNNTATPGSTVHNYKGYQITQWTLRGGQIVNSNNIAYARYADRKYYGIVVEGDKIETKKVEKSYSHGLEGGFKTLAEAKVYVDTKLAPVVTESAPVVTEVKKVNAGQTKLSQAWALVKSGEAKDIKEAMAKIQSK